MERLNELLRQWYSQILEEGGHGVKKSMAELLEMPPQSVTNVAKGDRKLSAAQLITLEEHTGRRFREDMGLEDTRDLPALDEHLMTEALRATSKLLDNEEVSQEFLKTMKLTLEIYNKFHSEKHSDSSNEH